MAQKPYIHQEYPKMVFKGTASYIVRTPEEHTRYTEEGWGDAPAPNVPIEPVGAVAKAMAGETPGGNAAAVLKELQEVGAASAKKDALISELKQQVQGLRTQVDAGAGDQSAKVADLEQQLADAGKLNMELQSKLDEAEKKGKKK